MSDQQYWRITLGWVNENHYWRIPIGWELINSWRERAGMKPKKKKIKEQWDEQWRGGPNIERPKRHHQTPRKGLIAPKWRRRRSSAANKVACGLLKPQNMESFKWHVTPTHNIVDHQTPRDYKLNPSEIAHVAMTQQTDIERTMCAVHTKATQKKNTARDTHA